MENIRNIQNNYVGPKNIKVFRYKRLKNKKLLYYKNRSLSKLKYRMF